MVTLSFQFFNKKKPQETRDKDTRLSVRSFIMRKLNAEQKQQLHEAPDRQGVIENGTAKITTSKMSSSV